MRKLLPGLALSLALSFAAPGALHAAAQEIVVCDFKGDAAGGVPATVPKDAIGELPLRGPTAANITGEGAKMSVESGGSNGFEKPVAVFVPGPHPNSPENASGIKLIWDLRSAHLGAGGVYVLEFTVIAMDLPIRGGGRIKFTLLDEDGKGLQNVGGVHVSQLPVLTFQGEKFGAANATIPVSTGQVIPVKMRIDLNSKTWDAWADGTQLVDKQPLPQALVDANPQISLGGFDFGSEGGFGDKLGGSYAIGDVRLVRSDE